MTTDRADAARPSRRSAGPAPGTMRALVHDGTTPALARRPRPVPGDGEALIRTRLAAVGSTDLEVCRGLLGFRGVLGHAFVGEVEALGGTMEPRAGGRGDDALVGSRVVGSTVTACGRCDMCQAGLGQHCRDRTLLGLAGRDGCLAEHFVLPARCLVPVPDSVDDDHAVFAAPLAAALQARRQLTIEGKPYITVLGDGPLGLLMVQTMARLNASVRLVGRYTEKLTVCEKWGIKHRHVDDVGRRADQDVVVDCTGSRTGLAVALELVRPRGTIVRKTLIAPPPPGGPIEPIDLSRLVLDEITVIGSHAGSVHEAIGVLARGEVDVVSLISRRMSLDDGTAVLDAAATPGVITVVVSP